MILTTYYFIFCKHYTIHTLMNLILSTAGLCLVNHFKKLYVLLEDFLFTPSGYLKSTVYVYSCYLLHGVRFNFCQNWSSSLSQVRSIVHFSSIRLPKLHFKSHNKYQTLALLFYVHKHLSVNNVFPSADFEITISHNGQFKSTNDWTNNHISDANVLEMVKSYIAHC